MSRQHATPVLVSAGGTAAQHARSLVAHGWNEDAVQSLIHANPTCLPIREIDPLFADPVPLCREMNTSAGLIDNVMVTATGLPVLVECKLWRNPQARREVVGQILDYAKELSRWTASDLQREVSRRTGQTVIELVRTTRPDLDEIDFTDALTLNLRRGRFLLLIVGDGIREGVEAIAEYLQGQAGLHFTLGLVEMPIFSLLDGSQLVVPRVLARTQLITRDVVTIPEGMMVVEAGEAAEAMDEDTVAFSAERQAFWQDFLSGLDLDDPDQPVPRPYKLGYISFALPAPGGSAWLTVYRSVRFNEMGLTLSCSRGSAGAAAVRSITADWQALRDELGGNVTQLEHDGRPMITEYRRFGPLSERAQREQAFAWLRPRVNHFINVLRSRIAAAVALTGD